MDLKDYAAALLLDYDKPDFSKDDPYSQFGSVADAMSGTVLKSASDDRYSTTDKIVAGLLTGMLGGGADYFSENYQDRAKDAYRRVVLGESEKEDILSPELFGQAEDARTLFSKSLQLEKEAAKNEVNKEIFKAMLQKPEQTIHALKTMGLTREARPVAESAETSAAIVKPGIDPGAAESLPSEVRAIETPKTRDQIYAENMIKYRGNETQAGKATEEEFESNKLKAATDPVIAAIGAKVPENLRGKAIEEKESFDKLNFGLKQVDELMKIGVDNSNLDSLLPGYIGVPKGVPYVGGIGVPLPTMESKKALETAYSDIGTLIRSNWKTELSEAGARQVIEPYLPTYFDTPTTRAAKAKGLKDLLIQNSKGRPILQGFGIVSEPSSETDPISSRDEDKAMADVLYEKYLREGGEVGPQGGAVPPKTKESYVESIGFDPVSLFTPRKGYPSIGQEGEVLNIFTPENQGSPTSMYGLFAPPAEVKEESQNKENNEDMARSEKFDTKVKEIASDLGTKPEHLFAVMNFETGGTFDPAEKNNAGSGATGLIQFMPSTAKELTGADSKEAAIKLMSSMSAEEQLNYVQKYLTPFKGKLKTLEDVYMAVLYPKAVGKDNQYALFKQGTTAYWQNRGLDIDKDGVITKGEAAAKVASYKA